jgi:hypothetical protein
MPSQLEPSFPFSTNPGLISHFVCIFDCILLFIYGNLAMSDTVNGAIKGLCTLAAHF